MAFDVADDEAPDYAMDGSAPEPIFVAAPAQAPVRARAWGATKSALAKDRVDYCRSLIELAVWIVAGLWILRRVAQGRTGHALDAVARSKVPH